MISFFRSNQVGIRTSPSFPSFRSTFSLPYSFSEIFFRYFWKICIITFWIIHGLILEKFAHANMLKFDEGNFAFTLTLILKQVELGNKVFPQVFVHTIVCRGYVKRNAVSVSFHLHWIWRSSSRQIMPKSMPISGPDCLEYRDSKFLQRFTQLMEELNWPSDLHVSFQFFVKLRNSSDNIRRRYRLKINIFFIRRYRLLFKVARRWVAKRIKDGK